MNFVLLTLTLEANRTAACRREASGANMCDTCDVEAEWWIKYGALCQQTWGRWWQRWFKTWHMLCARKLAVECFLCHRYDW